MTDDETPETPQDNGAEESAARPSGPPPKRDLEQAPLLLRKASTVLICGALIPWMTSISTLGKMPWGMWFAGVLLTGLAGIVLIEAAKANAGDKANGLVKSIAGAHPMAGTGAAMALFVVAIVVCMMASSYYQVNDKGEWVFDADGQPTFLGFSVADGADMSLVKDTFSIRGVLELATLFLALATFAHILAYEYGGKFNPVFPLMFLGPAVAGTLHVLTAVSQRYDNPLKIIGILGSAVVGAAGIMAMYTMYVTMKQAKIEGDRKAAEARERRRAERANRSNKK